MWQPLGIQHMYVGVTTKDLSGWNAEAHVYVIILCYYILTTHSMTSTHVSMVSWGGNVQISEKLSDFKCKILHKLCPIHDS